MSRRRLLGFILIPLLVIAVLAIGSAALLQKAKINVAALLESVIGPSPALDNLETALVTLRVPLDLLLIALAFLMAFIVSRLSHRISGWFFSVAALGRPATELTEIQVESRTARRTTSQQLVASLISFAAFTLASIFALSQFVSITNLAILATVLANAFGFAARDYIGDLLNGISNLFEDRFDIGDNIEIVRQEDDILGVVEQINIRTMSLRTRKGELVIVPQGQVRIIRNFTRGAFTGTDVTVAVDATYLVEAMNILVELGAEAPALIGDLLEPWRVISQEGKVNTVSELVIYAKAAYGRGAQLRLQIMSLAQQRLAAAGIPLAG